MRTSQPCQLLQRMCRFPLLFCPLIPGKTPQFCRNQQPGEVSMGHNKLKWCLMSDVICSLSSCWAPALTSSARYLLGKHSLEACCHTLKPWFQNISRVEETASRLGAHAFQAQSLNLHHPIKPLETRSPATRSSGYHWEQSLSTTRSDLETKYMTKIIWAA